MKKPSLYNDRRGAISMLIFWGLCVLIIYISSFHLENLVKLLSRQRKIFVELRAGDVPKVNLSPTPWENAK